MLQKAIGRYAKLSLVKKRQDNGAVEVREALHRKRHGNIVTVCGINLDACVMDTVTGLVCAGFKCRVIREATANTWDNVYIADARFPARVAQNSAYFTSTGARARGGGNEGLKGIGRNVRIVSLKNA